MSRSTKRMKSSHDTTAAYAASQPLFDALRLGVERMSEQHALLSSARDIAQQIHVKLAVAVSDRDASQQSKCIRHLVDAWQSATESFAKIFDELGKATAPVPSEGKEAFEGHDEFVKMAAMAAEANGVAKGFSLWKDQEAQSEDGEAETSESASEAASQTDADVAKAPQQSLLLSKEDKKGAKTRQRIEDSRQKREKKLLALRAKMKQSQNKSTATTNHTDPAPVEYEDVSAEVEARLKAKEAKREAAKKEKKRKRESGESFNSAVAVVENEKKPVRKKSKANGVGDEGERDVVAVKAKRKQDISTTAEVGGGKRKKARTKS